MAGGHAWWGVCMAGDRHDRSGLRDRGHSCWEGVCVMEGVCMEGCVCGRGVSAGEMATEAVGMHPTGMHSCCFLLRLIVLTSTLLSFTSKRRRYQVFCVDLFVSKYCYITIDAYCLKLLCYNKDIIL